MFKQYRVFSGEHGYWYYEGSFSARPREGRDFYLTGEELRDYVRAFAPPQRRKMLVTCGQLAQEFPENDFN